MDPIDIIGYRKCVFTWAVKKGDLVQARVGSGSLQKGAIKEVVDCCADVRSDGQLSFSVQLLTRDGEIDGDAWYGLESFDVIKPLSSELLWTPPAEKVYVSPAPKEIE